MLDGGVMEMSVVLVNCYRSRSWLIESPVYSMLLALALLIAASLTMLILVYSIIS
jgi:hypothetical protein